MPSSLYETDYQRWLQTMVHYLQERNFDAIDWNHLIEELESMGKSEKRALLSLLTRLLEHVLKLAYWESAVHRTQSAECTATFQLEFDSSWVGSPVPALTAQPRSEKSRSGKHWASEIVNFRAQIQALLEDSPSLRSQLPTFYEKAYPTAVKSVSKLFPLPCEPQISLSQLLDDDWFPELGGEKDQG